MAVNKVDLYVSQVKQLLNEGYTWLEKDNLGYGSIEAKFGANPVQIATIRKHPSLKDLETNITIFNVIDDDDDTTNKTKRSSSSRSNDVLEQPMVQMDGGTSSMDANDSTKTNSNAGNLFLNL